MGGGAPAIRFARVPAEAGAGVTAKAVDFLRHNAALARRLLRRAPASRAEVTRLAEWLRRPYPQYDGRYRDPAYRLIVATDTVATKGGTHFRPGDLSIARRDAGPDRDFVWVAFSWRTGADVAVYARQLVVVTESITLEEVNRDVVWPWGRLERAGRRLIARR